jgi:hypothetical protein
MIKNFWYIGQKGTFKETRGARVGASEVPALFPNPEKPTESLAGYDQTALTLYNKKIGEKPPFIPSLAAEMGHFLENKSLELFIRQFFGADLAKEFIKQKILYEMAEGSKEPESFQVGLFRHNTEYYSDGMIVHPDLIYLGDPGAEKITVNGITVDKSKPFYVEAKSARKEATKRRNESFVKGYDFDLTNWQGIPLKHYVQMQFQSAIFQIDTGYLPLLHNTSEFQVWRVDKDKKWQARIINTVGKMLKYIEMKVPPKEMAICLSDIISLYPNLRNDFITVTGEKAERIKEICKIAKKADRQIKNWQAQKKDASDALSVEMKDYDEIKDGSETLVKWRKLSGRESIGLPKEITGKLSFLKYLKLNDKVGYNYIVRKEWLKTGKDSRSVDIKFKE